MRANASPLLCAARWRDCRAIVSGPLLESELTQYSVDDYGYGIVHSLHSSYYWMDPASSPPRTMCAGDSGGPTGTWLGGYFMLHAINSHHMCGESLFDG